MVQQLRCGGQARGARPLRAWAWIAAAVLSGLVPGAAVAADDPCAGRHVRSLGGRHAVSQKALRDLADLQKRLPEFEAGMRSTITQDSTLGAGAADALLAAIQSGNGVSERKLARAEAMRWMAYQPEKGRIDRIVEPCVQLNKEYDAFEILVEVPEPMPTATPANCSLAVTRNCEHADPTITLDLTGSSAGARVERGGQPLAGQGSRFSIADDGPCSQDETFVVRATGPAAPPHTARVYRFVIPKACSNLAYLGEEPRVQLATTIAPATCEKSVAAPQCEPWAELSVASSRVEEDEPILLETKSWPDCEPTLVAKLGDRVEPIAIGADGKATWTPLRSSCGEPGYELRLEVENAAGKATATTANVVVDPHDWVVRPALAYFVPMDGDQSRDILLPGNQPARESYEVDAGLGVAVSLEHRPKGRRWGLEGAAIFGRTETSYELTAGGQTGEDDHNANFFAFTVGPNFHFSKCGPVDVYAGPFVGYGGLADPNYWVFGHHFQAQLSGEFIWGAQLGVDVPFNPDSNWGFHAGLRYFLLEQKSDAGTFDVDPLTVELGLAYRF